MGKVEIEKVNKLVSKLNKYRHEYYNLNNPSVSDTEYDKLFDELQKLELETGFVLSNSPTQQVGYEVLSKLEKIKHITPLKSLAKTKSIDELIKWKNNKDVIIMLKLDGLTVELDYENGILTEASTRGNGEIGELITSNAKQFKNIPLQIPFKGKLRVCGEAVIHYNDFEKINSKLTDDEKYATPRNLVSGSVRQLNSKICAEREVCFYAFSILECSEKLSDSKQENFKWLDKQGFWTILNTKIYEDIKIDYIINNMKKYAKEHWIPIDGMVLSYDSISYSNTLGETAHHPLHSVAYKFYDEIEETVLRNVEWNTTRSSQINPVAIFDTINLDNTEVNRATLFNLTFIKDMNLNIGCKIGVCKANQIIPYVKENFNLDKGLLKIPDRCPSCGEKTEIRNTGTAEFLFCTNENCKAKLVDKFVHFVKRDCMNIDGLSEAKLETLIVYNGFLKTFDDLFNLERFKKDIANLSGWGIKSYNNLIKAINNSKKVKLENFIYALGIPNIGKNSSKILAMYFNDDWHKFENALINKFDFTVLKDFGEITNSSLHNWYNNESEKLMWKNLINILEFEKEEEVKVNNNILSILSDKKIYCTGTFQSYKKDELKTLVESLGGEFANGYAKSLDFLVEGSLKSSTKVDKAKKDGVKVLTENEFLELIKGV